ncbi:hypothetical protein HK097_001966 [Rhizophlyctis rosea]|uniref:Uncharacterized protein n=1 Tax=Rhizophlyctis rosea TaxID=64517 RepID=A0AAD5X1J5_9FUNG|nr:hypothetical protein HK097_001966 [Rhizophlyctis rosea]
MFGNKDTKATSSASSPPRTATGHKNPNHLHSGMQKMTGSLQASMGRLTGNPHMVMKGEEKKIAAAAEADVARLHRNAGSSMPTVSTGKATTSHGLTGSHAARKHPNHGRF